MCSNLSWIWHTRAQALLERNFSNEPFSRLLWKHGKGGEEGSKPRLQLLLFDNSISKRELHISSTLLPRLKWECTKYIYVNALWFSLILIRVRRHAANYTMIENRTLSDLSWKSNNSGANRKHRCARICKFSTIHICMSNHSLIRHCGYKTLFKWDYNLLYK